MTTQGQPDSAQRSRQGATTAAVGILLAIIGLIGGLPTNMTLVATVGGIAATATGLVMWAIATRRT